MYDSLLSAHERHRAQIYGSLYKALDSSPDSSAIQRPRGRPNLLYELSREEKDEVQRLAEDLLQKAGELTN